MQALTMDQLDDMTAQIEATKLSLVTREQTKSAHNIKADRFIADHQEEWKVIGEQCRARREKRGLTQLYIANALGVSATKISQYERGRCVCND